MPTKPISSKKKQPVKAEQEKAVALPAERYIETVGRRKTSVARVRVTPQKIQSILVNGKNFEEYFQDHELQSVVIAPLEKSGLAQPFQISVLVKGGGVRSQAEAVRHGITRALVAFEAGIRGVLKTTGFLTRDPRMRERKKFGLKRARRARQWRKR